METAVTRRRRWTCRQRALLWAAGHVLPPTIRALGATLTVELPEGLPPELTARPPQAAIYAFWHCCLLPVTWYLRGQRVGVMISRHFDGEWIAAAAARLGYVPFRGSSSRGGGEALTEMADAVLGGLPVAFTVDGPRGPRFQAKAGPVYLARRTGVPLYAIHVVMDHAWTLKSWDAFQIPKPGSTVRGLWAGPYYVPPDASPGVLEDFRRQLEESLNRLRQRGNGK